MTPSWQRPLLTTEGATQEIEKYSPPSNPVEWDETGVDTVTVFVLVAKYSKEEKHFLYQLPNVKQQQKNITAEKHWFVAVHF